MYNNVRIIVVRDEETHISRAISASYIVKTGPSRSRCIKSDFNFLVRIYREKDKVNRKMNGDDENDYEGEVDRKSGK